ncbi:MAG: ATP-binding protein [Pseudomonadota bacterium]
MVIRPLSLSYRLGMTLATGLLFFGLMVGLAVYQGASEMLYQSQHERAQALVRQLATFSIDAVLVYDYATLERYVGQFGQDSDILFIDVRRADNELLAQIGERPDPKQSRYRTIIEPMLLGTTHIGYVELIYDKLPAQAKLNYIGIIGFITLTMMVIAAFWLQRNVLERSVIRPVQRLARVVSPLSVPQEYDIKEMPVELQRLASTFQDLRDEVQTHINERTKAEKLARSAAIRLCKDQRLASVGLMAAGLAHALNTPLGNIRGYTQLARENLSDSQLDSQLAVIEEQTAICAAVVENLLTAVRPPETHLSNFALKTHLETTLSLMRPVLQDKGVKAIILKDEIPVLVRADPASLEQIIFNLFSNAAQAGAQHIQVSIKSNLSKVYILVSDDGHGLPTEMLDQLFEAFNTTKAAGKGTGLGLHLCRSLAKDMGGEIQLVSTNSTGTAFEITLQEASECSV